MAVAGQNTRRPPARPENYCESKETYFKLRQSHVGIVGLKIVNSLIKSHKSLRKIQKTEQITRDFCCIFYRFVDFLTLNTLTQLYLKKLYTFRTNIVSRSYRIIKDLTPTVIAFGCTSVRGHVFSPVFGVIFTFAWLCQRS